MTSSTPAADAFDFEPLFSDRAAAFQPSPVRSVWEIMLQPGILSLAGGNPDLSGLPLEELAETAAELIRERGTEILQYGSSYGMPELREALLEPMRDVGIEVTADDVLITPGSQMGIELVAQVLCNPGDVVLAESPTYVGAIGTFRGMQVDVRHVECDAEGIVPEALAAQVERLRDAGHTVKLLYTIPNFGNPSGVTMTQERRAAISTVCREQGIALVEDDPYGQLVFDGEPPRAIRAIDDRVIYLGSLSKIFAPGLRVGWMVAPPEVRARLVLAGQAATIHAAQLSQALAAAYLTRYDWRGILAKELVKYRARAEAMLSALEAHMPEGVTWTTPQGGFFVWVTLPDDIDTAEVFTEAVHEQMVFITGDAFFATPMEGQALRLSFTPESPENITEAVRRLGRAIAAVRERHTLN